MGTGRGAMLVLAFAALLLSACDDSSPADPAPPLAALVPADAHLYAETTLRMGGEPARPARGFVARLTDLREIPDDALVRALDDLFGLDLPSWEELDPWLGDRGALFLAKRRGETVGGLVLQTTDAEAALRFLRREVSGLADPTVVRSIRGHVVLGAPAAVRAAAGARRAPLAGTPRFRALAEGGRPFALTLADRAKARADLLDAVGASPATESLLSTLDGDGHLGLRLEVREREAMLRVHRTRRADEPPEPIGRLPGDAWLAVSTGDIGGLLSNPLGAALGSRLSLAGMLASFTGAPLPPSLLRQLRSGTLFFQGHHAQAAGELRVKVGSRRAADRAMLRYAAALRRRSGETVEVFRSHRANPGIFTHVPGEESEGEAVTETFLNGRTLSLVFGPGGSADFLEETPLYREAERALGEPPTALVDVPELLELIDPGSTRDDSSARRLAFFAIAESPRGKRFRWTFLVRLAP